jgi:uncharacterized membrane protein YvlD (DUF360 family)
MIHFIIRLIVNAIALMIVAYVLPGVHVTGIAGAIVLFYWVGHMGIGLVVEGFWTAFIGAIVLGIVSFILSWVFGGIEAKA